MCPKTIQVVINLRIRAVCIITNKAIITAQTTSTITTKTMSTNKAISSRPKADSRTRKAIGIACSVS